MATKPRPIGTPQSAADCRHAVVVSEDRVKCSKGHWGKYTGFIDGTASLHYVLYMGGPRKCQLCKDFEDMG